VSAPGTAYGQSFAKVGIVGAQFLKIEVGARYLAMGSTSMAATKDAPAIFWNPSGLTSVQNASAVVSHMNWLADIQYESAGVAKNFPGIGVAGLFFSYLSSGEMEITTELEQDGTGDTFTYTDLMVGLSFARNLTHRFAFGGNVKYIKEDFGFNDIVEGVPVLSQQIAFDIGTQYATGFKSLRMGLAIQHFGPELRPTGKYEDIFGFDSKADTYLRDSAKKFKAYPMPMTFRAGLAMEILERDNQVLTIAADVLHPSDNVERLHLGAEFVFLKTLALRAGYIINGDAQRFALGAGFNLGPIALDYAYLDFGILRSVQSFSAVFNL